MQKQETQPVSVLDKPPQTAYIAKVSERIQNALAEAEAQERLFALKQREIMPYAKSSLVPQAYQNRPENCLIAREMAERIGASILTVMQNLYIVHGSPAWSAAFAISCFNTCGRFRAIWYEFDGDGDDYGCVACTQERDSGRILRGVKVTWRMAKAEGWTAKNGSKWKTMPELMFRYRAATFLIRTTAPELLNGMRTIDEIEDVYGQERRTAFEVVEHDKDAPTGSKILDAAVASATETEPSKAEETRLQIEAERQAAIRKARELKNNQANVKTSLIDL